MDEERKEIESLAITETAGYKNLIAIKDYTVKTREMFRVIEKENKIYKDQVLEQGKVIQLLKTQIQHLQIKTQGNKATG